MSIPGCATIHQGRMADNRIGRPVSFPLMLIVGDNGDGTSSRNNATPRVCSDMTSNEVSSDKNANGEPMEVLGESDCWALLRGTSIGRIAYPTSDGGVAIFPVNHLVDQGSIVFRTAAGTKLAGSTSATEVVFEADDSDSKRGVAWSVILRGHAEMITVAADLFESFDLNVRPWHASRKPYFVRVVPMSTTGRRFNIDRSAQT